ncbi:hypothetical protein F4825DRAFT_476521 [Nemania diffusa]|nr:hypothetical protein F4825DRAFT_476521 [Nemania diffusa]
MSRRNHIRPNVALTDFTWQGDPLPRPPNSHEECQTDEEATAFLIQKLLLCSDPHSRLLLEETQTVRRLCQLQKILRWRFVPAWISHPTLTNNLRITTAIAYYLLAGIEAPVTCNRCAEQDVFGPGEKCVVVDNRFLGACTNCYYSGVGKRCSIRMAEEERVMEEYWRRVAQRASMPQPEE